MMGINNYGGVPYSLRRRIRSDIGLYVRPTYEWLDPTRFDSFDHFMDRVIFSVVRDLVNDVSIEDYDNILSIREKITPYVTEIIKDDFFDEIKSYYDSHF